MASRLRSSAVANLPFSIRAAGVLIVAAGICSMSQAASVPLKYPEARRTNFVETLHGVEVADPYRWLEDDNAAETKAWVEAENKVTFAYLASIPERDRIRKRLEELWNFERFGLPSKHGSRYFISRNSGLQNQAVLYTMDSLTAEQKVLLDPNTLSADGTVALSGMSVSKDGTLLAYGVSRSGSDWQEWLVRDVETGKDLPDKIEWVKFSGASWLKDGSGFFYSRYDAPTEETKLSKANYFHKLCFHKLGTKQSEDRLVYERPDEKEWNFGGDVTDDGRYLIITASQGTDPKNRVFYAELANPAWTVKPLLTDFDADYSFLDNEGPVFWFRTDLKAPRNRVIAIDTTQPERANWRELIPQTADKLEGVSTVGGRFTLNYLQDAHSVVQTAGFDGKPLGEIKLPGIGSAGGFGGERTDTETFYSYSGYTTPATSYRIDLKTGETTVFRKPSLPFKSEEYETRQVFFTSKDGTRIPMFITARKGLKFDGSNPSLLYGYGGFNISLTPGFSTSVAGWLELGGVYAVVNLRGGGEYGEEWHAAGTKHTKQNVFDDCIAAAEYLVKEKITSSKKLALMGGSNGGLLVGAVLNQRPDLFAAGLPAVGVMDMLRFHKFTIGWAWTSDYGTPDDAEDFKALYAISPYHNLKPGTKYPAIMVTTGDHDDRVVPAHSFKYAARLQTVQAGDAPVLIRIETKAGHGAGKPTSKLIEEAADKWAFLYENLGMRSPAPNP
jgi:prolyl oligopeptidase